MLNILPLVTDGAAEAGGYMITTVSLIVVFSALVILIAIFMSIPKILAINLNRKLKKAGIKGSSQAINVESDVNVAIAMALHMYFDELHDEESNIITIKNAPKQYSPWSSKIYGVHNQPIKR